MTDISYTDTVPVFVALGNAVFEAQHLEAGLSLLLQFLNQKTAASKAPPSIDTPDAPQTIGQLFRQVRLRKYLTDAERSAIQAGVKERNLLIHAYWDTKRTMALNNPSGRAWIFSDLERIREIIRKGGRTVDAIIDRYLKEKNTSLSELSRPLWETWEPGIEPPPDVIH